MFGIFKRSKKDRWEDLVGKKILFRLQMITMHEVYFEADLRAAVVQAIGPRAVLINNIWRDTAVIKVHAVFDDDGCLKPVNLP